MESKKEKEFKKDEKVRSAEEMAIRARVEDDDVTYMFYVPANAPVFFDD